MPSHFGRDEAVVQGDGHPSLGRLVHLVPPQRAEATTFGGRNFLETDAVGAKQEAVVDAIHPVHHAEIPVRQHEVPVNGGEAFWHSQLRKRVRLAREEAAWKEIAADVATFDGKVIIISAGHLHPAGALGRGPLGRPGGPRGAQLEARLDARAARPSGAVQLDFQAAHGVTAVPTNVAREAS